MVCIWQEALKYAGREGKPHLSGYVSLATCFSPVTHHSTQFPLVGSCMHHCTTFPANLWSLTENSRLCGRSHKTFYFAHNLSALRCVEMCSMTLFHSINQFLKNNLCKMIDGQSFPNYLLGIISS